MPRCARFTHVPHCRHPLSTTPRQHTHFRALRHTLCPFLSIFTYFYSFFNLFLRVFYVFLRVFTRVQPTAHISDKQHPPLHTLARFLALFRRKNTFLAQQHPFSTVNTSPLAVSTHGQLFSATTTHPKPCYTFQTHAASVLPLFTRFLTPPTHFSSVFLRVFTCF